MTESTQLWSQSIMVDTLSPGDLVTFPTCSYGRYLVLRKATIEDEIDGSYGLPGDKVCLVLYDDELPPRVVLMHGGWWVNVLVKV